MLNEIKFRGKSVDTQDWIYGGIAMSNDKFFIAETTKDGYINLKEVVPETVGQFTRENDKNGNNIFQGDIVRYKYSYSEPLIHPVIYWKSGFYVDDKCKLGLLPLSWIVENRECEVIGNIHYNHYLLGANDLGN